MHIIDQEEPSEEFQAAWNSAGKHIQAQCRGGIKWIRVNLRRPFIEHFSFIIGNQLFFVFVEAEEFELSNRYDAFIGAINEAQRDAVDSAKFGPINSTIRLAQLCSF